MADEPLTEAEIAVLLGESARRGAFEPTAPEQLLALVTRIHDVAARHFGAELSAMLRRTVRVRVGRLQSLRASDFCARTELPSFVRRFEVKPFQGCWLLEIRPGALFPIIDCLLGGGREKTPIARRPLTEIESRLASRVARAWLESLRGAWQSTVALDFSADFQPLKTGCVGDDEMLAIAFDIELAGSQGSLHLAIPLVELSTVCIPGSSGSARCHAAEETRIAVELPVGDIDPADLDSLAVGDIITTEHRADAPVVVTLNGVPRFAAKLGARQGKKAVEIERDLEAGPPSSGPSPASE